MNETQILIKTSIENETKQQLGVDVIVEYVPNISLRKQELQKQAGEKFNSVYNADHFTGTFIPAIGNNPYYILVQENRESMLDIMTAFHEYKHLIDYVLFFKVVCDNDIELLKKSLMYITFNVYSEYSATRFGVKKYIETVNFEDMNQKELAESILEIAKKEYRNLQGVKNRYQLLVHSMQYLGNIMGCSIFVDSADIQSLISEMELLDELLPTFNHIIAYENTYEWYENLDRIMRDFVDGGANS